MYKVTFDVRSDKRYVVYLVSNLSSGFDFRKHYSVEIEAARYYEPGNLIDSLYKSFSVETCWIESPENKTFYTLIGRNYSVAKEIYAKLSDIMIQHRVIKPGTPVMFEISLGGRIHRRNMMNPGLCEIMPLERQVYSDLKQAEWMYEQAMRGTCADAEKSEKLSICKRIIEQVGKFALGHELRNGPELLKQWLEESLELNRRQRFDTRKTIGLAS